jgi:hypothetical protein
VGEAVVDEAVAVVAWAPAVVCLTPVRPVAVADGVAAVVADAAVGAAVIWLRVPRQRPRGLKL